jgi:hypothetical protein
MVRLPLRGHRDGPPTRAWRVWGPRRGFPAKWRGLVGVSIALGVAGAPGCHRAASEAIGLPDAYLLFVSAHDQAGRGRRGPTGLPVLEALPLDDARAVPFHKLFAVGFAAELLRTDYLRKQFVREAHVAGKGFAPAALAAAVQPTIFVLADDAPFVAPYAGRGMATIGFFGGAAERPNVPWIAVPPSPDGDTALAQTVSRRLGRSIAAAIAAGGVPEAEAPPGTVPAVLVEGYATAMEVIAREWRVGDGPRGTLAPDAGTAAQREVFAAVRQNRYVMASADAHAPLRPAAEMLADPGVAATVLYRMAQSKGVGHRVAAPEVYAPFVSERIPAGISPAAVLGPFRNAQAKLISAWSGAVLRGAPPRDIIDLVETYAAEMPQERAEVIRLFVVTTFGATVKPGGVTTGSGAADPLPELTALAAEVAAGRRPLRAALNAGK